ncbi:MAG: fatty acid desaturase [Bacteroidota bacterium]
MMASPQNQRETSNTSWIKIVTKYNRPDALKSWWQLSVNLFLYSIAWFLMYESLSISWWITFALSLPAAGMLVRLFIIYHDCGHGAFFKSEKLNNSVGLFIGILTFTPYYSWSYQHHIHHETAGNLDKRGIGDVWTMTVDEYRESSAWQKIMYRFYRHPVTMFGIGAFYVFVIGNRFTKKYMDNKGRLGVYATNAGLLFFAASMSLLIGVKAFILIQLPIIAIAGIFGFWLFYVQHQFDPTYWSRTNTWNYQRMALEGSSYYKLPRILQFFSGNIGFHHIHHLSPLIPNYKLARCQRENTLFQDIKPLTFWASFKTLTYRLWDEKEQQMVSFRNLKLSGAGGMTSDELRVTNYD